MPISSLLEGSYSNAYTSPPIRMLSAAIAVRLMEIEFLEIIDYIILLNIFDKSRYSVLGDSSSVLQFNSMVFKLINPAR